MNIKEAIAAMVKTAHLGGPGADVLRRSRRNRQRRLASPTANPRRWGLDTNRWPSARRIQPSETARHYFDVILPALKARKDPATYNATRYGPDMSSRMPMYYSPRDMVAKGRDGYYHLKGAYMPSAGAVGFWDRAPDDYIQAHEGRHWVDFDGDRGVASGRSKQDDDLYSRVYGFSPSAVAKNYGNMPSDDELPELVRDEQGAFNAENEIRLVNSAKRELGHLPSPEEYLQFLHSRNEEQLVDNYMDSLLHNAYALQTFREAAGRVRKQTQAREAYERQLEAAWYRANRAFSDKHFPFDVGPDASSRKRVSYDDVVDPDSLERLRLTDWYVRDPDFFENEFNRLREAGPNGGLSFRIGDAPATYTGLLPIAAWAHKELNEELDPYLNNPVPKPESKEPPGYRWWNYDDKWIKDYIEALQSMNGGRLPKTGRGAAKA